MIKIGPLNVAALIASVMVVAIALVLVPSKSWSSALIISLVLFALSVGFLFYAPSVISANRGNTDATQFAAIGPVGSLSVLFLIISAVALALAVFHHDKFSFATDIFAVGLFLISTMTLKTAMNVVADASNKSAQPSNHIRWQSEIISLRGLASDQSDIEKMDQLAETFRYSPSDIPGGTPQDEAIDTAIATISTCLESNASDLTENINKLKVLLAKRDIFLRTARNKA